MRCVNFAPLRLQIDNVNGLAADQVLFSVLVDLQLHLVFLDGLAGLVLLRSGSRLLIIRFLDLNLVFQIYFVLCVLELDEARDLLLLLLVLLLLHPLVLFSRLFWIGSSKLLDLFEGFLGAIAHYC